MVQVAELFLFQNHLATHVLVFDHVLVYEHDLFVDTVLFGVVGVQRGSLQNVLFVHFGRLVLGGTRGFPLVSDLLFLLERHADYELDEEVHVAGLLERREEMELVGVADEQGGEQGRVGLEGGEVPQQVREQVITEPVEVETVFQTIE